MSEHPALNRAAEAFGQWRRDRTNPREAIPDALLDLAVEASYAVGMATVVNVLRVNRARLNAAKLRYESKPVQSSPPPTQCVAPAATRLTVPGNPRTARQTEPVATCPSRIEVTKVIPTELPQPRISSQSTPSAVEMVSPQGWTIRFPVDSLSAQDFCRSTIAEILAYGGVR